jgi:glycerol-3-phosphate dehydrogenase
MNQSSKGENKMAGMEDKTHDKLRKEANEWIETELAIRMKHADAEIERQADISSISCGEEGAKRHIKTAHTYAEEEIRRDLEHEARLWLEDELKRRENLRLQDRKLDDNWC